jgi:hypothetical protein
VLCTDRLGFDEVQRMGRFARYWDLVGNSGRFVRSRRLLLGDAPFARFLAFSDWLYAMLGRTHQIAADRLYDLVHRWLLEQDTPPQQAAAALALDFRDSGLRSIPGFLQPTHQPRPGRLEPGTGIPARQRRHVKAGGGPGHSQWCRSEESRCKRTPAESFQRSEVSPSPCGERSEGGEAG